MKLGRKKQYTPQQVAAVIKMLERGEGFGSTWKEIGMTTSKVRRFVQQSEEEL